MKALPGMSFFSEHKLRSFLPLAGLGLAAYYLLVFEPLDRKAAKLDAPLQRDWQRLSASLEEANARTLDFLHMTNQVRETRQALQIVEQAKQKAKARLELGAAVRARMNAPFELVEYHNQRSKQLDDLLNLAKQQQATLEPAVLAGFPEHTVDVKQPALLWAALSFINGLLTTALQCKVSAIHSLAAPLSLTNVAPTDVTGQLAEIPLQIELTGSVPSVLRLIQTLPLRADEIRAAGLVEAHPEKAPLYIDKLMIKKQSPDKPDEVRVWLRVVGFVFRE